MSAPVNQPSLEERADAECRKTFGDAVFVRGLIEATSRCVMDCAYCGIRRGNPSARRYALSDDDILSAARKAYGAGIRTFVIQGGEDPDFGAPRLSRIVAKLRGSIGDDFAVTLSFGEMSRREYRELREAGCDRYLMRFETSDQTLFRKLRGTELSRRLRALDALRDLGFEVGSGFMTGLPGAGPDALEHDVRLAAGLGLDMVGIGPFIPHPGTPLGAEPGLGVEPAVKACAMTRLALPLANIPATTAAGSAAPDGRERMLAAGANVLMPNVGPRERKRDYELYPGKICLDEDGLACVGCLSGRVASVGKRLDFSRGDSPSVLARRVAAANGEGRATA